MTEPVEGRTAARYSWDAIEPDHPVEKATRRLVKGEHAMVARFVLDEGLDVTPHVHHNEQITYLLEGVLKFWIGEAREEVILKAGEVLLIPANVPHEAEGDSANDGRQIDTLPLGEIDIVGVEPRPDLRLGERCLLAVEHSLVNVLDRLVDERTKEDGAGADGQLVQPESGYRHRLQTGRR